MAKLQGHVDALGRPLVAVVSTATGDPFLATVDTGFNGGLIIAAADAPTIGVKVAPDARVVRVELGDGRTELVRTGRVDLHWLGSRRELQVFLSDGPSRFGEGQPIALIGVELLAPHLLLVDYGARTVDIETQDD